MMNVSEWQNSPHYSAQVHDILQRIKKRAELSENESQTASAFEQEIYYILRETFGIELYIKKEQSVSNLRHTVDLHSKRRSGK